jgi:hypothetical protein
MIIICCRYYIIIAVFGYDSNEQNFKILKYIIDSNSLLRAKYKYIMII